jgi:uncharacterized protein (TIGR02996 family)
MGRMSDRESLWSVALGQPDDDRARLVLADFLREQADTADVGLGRFLWAGVVAGRYWSAAWSRTARAGWRSRSSG